MVLPYPYLSGVQAVNGQFSKGLPQGRATVVFTDHKSAEVHFRGGVLDGRVRQFGSDGKVQVIGLYAGGLPHGPVWILPYSLEDEGATLVSPGYIIQSKITSQKSSMK